MTRALPFCAGCGKKPSSRNGYVLQHWQDVKGSPQVAWCGECSHKENMQEDELFGHANQRQMPLASLLSRIHARGEGRVSLRPPYTIEDAMASAAKIEATK